MFDNARTLGRRVLTSYVTYVVLGLVVGLTFAPVAWFAASASGGTVAVVPVAGTIDGATSANYAAMMERAREDDSIDAVVLVANSGGGSAPASEEMYLQTKRTAAEIPVVASVDAGALSGAYQTIVASDQIYVKPASRIGSIGVLTTLGPDIEPNSVIATSGPNKLTGVSERELFYQITAVQNGFVGSVYEQRGANISIPRSEVEEAKIYVGAQAVENGLADEIGGREAAIRHAARSAGLESYDVELLWPDGAAAQFLSRGNYLAADVPNKEMVSPTYLTGDRGAPPVMLMVPRSYLLTDGSTGEAEPTAASDRNNATPAAPTATAETEVTDAAS